MQKLTVLKYWLFIIYNWEWLRPLTSCHQTLTHTWRFSSTFWYLCTFWLSVCGVCWLVLASLRNRILSQTKWTKCLLKTNKKDYDLSMLYLSAFPVRHFTAIAVVKNWNKNASLIISENNKLFESSFVILWMFWWNLKKFLHTTFHFHYGHENYENYTFHRYDWYTKMQEK